MITRNFNLFLNAGHSIPLVINVNQAEEGEQWVFSLFQEDGTPYIPTDGSIVGIKSDGYLINNSGTVVDGKVVIAETRQMTAAAGKSVFELRIDGLTHGTANFIVLVEKDPTNGGIVSDSDLSLIEEALSAVSPLPTGGTVGQVLTKTANGSAWSDAGTPTQEQVAEAVSNWADENITVTTGVVIDTSLAVAGAAADSKKVGDEISDLKSQIDQSTGMSAEFKQALENLLSKVAYIDENGQTYLDALHTAMYPPASLTRISAVYTQSGTVYNTDSLDDLKSDLVVTAYYSNGITELINTYTLSGTLTEGTSTITVSYGGKTATFNVAVTYDDAVYRLKNAVFTGSEGVVNTGIKLLETNTDYTILVKYTRSSSYVQSTSTVGVFACMETASPWWGLKMQIPPSTSGARYDVISYGQTNSSTFNINPISDNMLKVAVRHTAGTSTAKWKIADETGTVKTATVGSTSKTIDADLKVGQKNFIGTINSFAVYDKVLSDSEVTDFLENA